MQTTAKKGLGILFILGAALCFALMNLFVNLAGELPLMQKVFFRNGLTVIVVFVILCFQKEHFRIHSKQCIPWHLLRSGIGLLGVVLNFYAIDHIGSISDASILNKLSPFFAILFSVFLLKEKPKIPEIIFVLLAFAGAMCVVNPRFDMEVLPALSGFASGACAGFAYTCVRILGVKGERGIMTVFFFAAFSTVISLPLMIAFYQPMTLLQLLWLLLAGAAATGGQFCITAAYRQAPAKEIAVFDYMQVFFAAILGFLFLRQVPKILSFIGYAVIIGAAVGQWAYHMGKARRAQKQAQLVPQTPNQDMPASDELLSPADMPLSDGLQPSHNMSADPVSPLEQDSLPAGMPVSDGMTPSADMPPADADPSAEHVPSIADMSPSNELPKNTDTPPSEEKASDTKPSSSERKGLRKKNNQ